MQMDRTTAERGAYSVWRSAPLGAASSRALDVRPLGTSMNAHHFVGRSCRSPILHRAAVLLVALHPQFPWHDATELPVGHFFNRNNEPWDGLTPFLDTAPIRKPMTFNHIFPDAIIIPHSKRFSGMYYVTPTTSASPNLPNLTSNSILLRQSDALIVCHSSACTIFAHRKVAPAQPQSKNDQQSQATTKDQEDQLNNTFAHRKAHHRY